MKKTLLLTTALIGTLSVLNSAQAEVKIGAHVKTAWKSFENQTTNAASLSGFTQERQIDLSTSGTLNNGVKYAAGFSLEQDASQVSGFDGSEGNYVNVTVGNTTLELGNDHILNGDYNIVPRAGNAMNEEAGSGGDGSATNAGNLAFNQALGTIKEAIGVGIVQKLDNATLAINYVPKVATGVLYTGSSTTNTGKAYTADTDVPTTATGKGGYEVVLQGGYGVPGLNTIVNYSTAKMDGSSTQDMKTIGVGASYTTGMISFGAERVKHDAFDGSNMTTTEFGVVAKINDAASIGVGTVKSSGTTTAGVANAEDEKIKYLQVGYNLGAIGTQFSYIKIENRNYVAASDPNGIVLKVNTKF